MARTTDYDSPALSPVGHGLLWPAILLGFLGWIVELAGLASLQHVCSPAFFGGVADAKLTAGFPLALGCGSQMRFLWFILALAFFTLLVLAVLAATGHGRPGGWLSMIGLTAVATALQCVLTDRAYNSVSASYNAPPGAGPVLPRAQTFFAGAIIKTTAMFLAMLAIGAAVDTARDADEDDEGGAYGKRRREGYSSGVTGRVAVPTPMSTTTIPTSIRDYPQPTGPVAVV